MSDGEKARPRRRRGRRRDKRAGGAADTAKPHSEVDATTTKPARNRRPTDRLRTVHETSAGGLVVDGLDDPQGAQMAALIGRVDRRGRMLWSLPKGHIELGETAEQTAIREVAEETGIQGDVLASLGSIDYWFVTEGRRVHKTVHHYLLRFLGGELSDHDLEVSEVAWVPLDELPSRLAYADERRLAEVADGLIQTLQTQGLGALPPLPHSTPWRRRQTHSSTRQRADEPLARRAKTTDEPLARRAKTTDEPLARRAKGSSRTNGHGRP